jgi:hypothetical protein
MRGRWNDGLAGMGSEEIIGIQGQGSSSQIGAAALGFPTFMLGSVENILRRAGCPGAK